MMASSLCLQRAGQGGGGKAAESTGEDGWRERLNTHTCTRDVRQTSGSGEGERQPTGVCVCVCVFSYCQCVSSSLSGDRSKE